MVSARTDASSSTSSTVSLPCCLEALRAAVAQAPLAGDPPVSTGATHFRPYLIYSEDFGARR